jgi:hypothetical protein
LARIPLCTLTTFLFLGLSGYAIEIPSSSELHARLTSSIATYSNKPGDAISAVLTAPVELNGELLLPAGVQMAGRIGSVRKVGWGFVHETARVRLDFDTLVMPDKSEVRIKSVLVAVENARESVDKTGTIRGIRATAQLSASISSRLIHLPTLNLYIDPVMLGYHLLFPVFPESEIHLPRGTDIRLRLVDRVSVPELPDTRPPEISDEDAARATKLAEDLPGRSVTGKLEDPIPADFVSILFLGDRAQIESAFQAAQWNGTDRRSARSSWRYFGAFLASTGYKTAPLSKQWLGGNPPDLARQKSFNSVAERHHLRIWKWDGPSSGEDAWVATATRDIDIAPSLRRRRIVHNVEGNVDREREKVVNDLAFAGCVAGYSYVARPDFPRSALSPEGDKMATDGRLAVVRLKPCGPAPTETASVAEPRSSGNRVQRYIRRQVLTFRNELVRGNLFYGAYDGVSFVWHCLYPRPPQDMGRTDSESFLGGRTLRPPEASDSGQ